MTWKNLINRSIKKKQAQTLNYLINILNFKGLVIFLKPYILQTWNDGFDLTDGLYSIAEIQEYFGFIIKKHETLTENFPVQNYPNKIRISIVFVKVEFF